MRARALLALVALLAGPALATLPIGSSAPDFTLPGALAGKPLTFSLRQALKKGPVVLYFFPATFAPGCTIDAHAFADASDRFHKLHAVVIGLTVGTIDQVAAFSKTECSDKFAVVADPAARIAQRYDGQSPLGDRTSYVIAPDGRILLGFRDRNPATHIARTLATLADLGRPKG